MLVSVSQIKKLKGKSLREIRLRGKQEFAKLNERLFGLHTAEMSDAALVREINFIKSGGSGEGSSALILERIRNSITPDLYEREIPVFLPSLAYRDDIPAIVQHCFPDQWQALIERANRAIEGRFDLLGFADLSFGDPIDWHLEPLSGKRTKLSHWSQIDYLNPAIAGDKKVTWELNRHAHFVTFGQAYWLTNDERFAEAFVAQATSWMNANPPNLGINWASSLELAFRIIAWLWALHLFAESHHLTSKFVTRLLKFLVAQGRHIEAYLSHYFSPNTHLTGEALGLLYLGVALPELSRAKIWRQMGLRILLEQLPSHIRKDGVYFEQASYYHRYTADFFIHLLTLARSCYLPLPVEVEQRLQLALDHLMWITRPDQTTPLFGDDDGGRLLKLGERPANDFRDTLATGAALFNRGDWKYVASDAAVETLWLLGPEGLERYNEIEVQPPTQQARAFTEGGYYVMRDGWHKDPTYALIDCGPLGIYNCGHGHADALAFEFAAQGTTWLVDPGTFTYTADSQLRNQFRETAAHNTATVDGQSQSEPAEAFTWNHMATSQARDFLVHPSFAYFEGAHDGYVRLADPVIHARGLLFQKQDRYSALPTYLCIEDDFSAQSQHDYAIYFHFAPSCTAIASANQIRATHHNGHKLALYAFNAELPQAEILQGWVSEVYGARQSAPVGVIKVTAEGAQKVTSFILPFSEKNQGAQVERQPLSDGAAFTVTLGDSQDVWITGQPTPSVECKGLSATAKLAWARFVGGRLLRAGCVKGNAIGMQGKFQLRSTDTIQHCVIQVNSEGLDISIEGTQQFSLDTEGGWQKVTLEGKCFVLHPEQPRVAFARHDGAWCLKEATD